MKGSDLIAEVLAEHQVTHVYELVGGMITHILDSLATNGRFTIVSMHHEQSAAFASECHARMSGRPFVALATSGPGATNLLTGIGSCFFDSIPAVFITGQVNRHEMKGESKVRQLGFQETDIVSMARPITKAAFQVLDPKDLQATIESAFRIASEGRPGPVLVDVPMDIQRLDVEYIPSSQTKTNKTNFLETDFQDIETAFRQSHRPMILLGGGIRSGNAKAGLDRLLAQFSFPVCHSLMGMDALHSSHPLHVGLIGSYGNRWANHAIGSSDTLLVLGSRLDIRQTGASVESFRGNKTVFHVDCDVSETNHRVKDCKALIGNLADFLDQFVAYLGEKKISVHSDWLNEIQNLKHKFPDTNELISYPGINPNRFIHELSKKSKAAKAFITDVGQHQMWAAQSVEIAEDQRFLTSGGMGSMGFALPGAIGASFACNSGPVVVIAGDGGIQCNLQELETIKRNDLPIKIVVLDNGCLGMVRQFQESYFESRFQSTKNGYSAPSFVRIAEAYGIPGLELNNEESASEALDWLWNQQGPALLQVRIEEATNVYPKLAFGRSFLEMEPDAKPLDMEGT